MVDLTKTGIGKKIAGTRAAATLAVLLAATSVTCDLFSNPRTSRYQTSGAALDVAVRNDTLAVAQGDSGLLLLDISDPKSPREIRRLVLFSRCGNLALGDSVVYVSVSSGAYAYFLPSGGRSRLDPQGDSQAVTALLKDSARLFMAAADGVSIFDITSPGVPIPAGFIPLAGYPTGLARRDSRLFVSLRDWGVRVLNILPGDSFVLDTLQLGKHNRAEGVTMSAGGYCIISQGDSGIVVYYSPTADTVRYEAAAGDKNTATYAAAATDGVQEVSIYSADSCSVAVNKLTNRRGDVSFSGEADFVQFTGFSRRICRGGNGYVYTASGDAGVYIIRE